MNLRSYIENPSRLHENRLPARSLLIPAQKRGVTHRNYTESDRITSLCGEWSFRYLADGKITDAEKDFFSSDYDDSGWDKISVPSMWQFCGYGTCLYPNVEYPFPLDPPYIHTVNPIGLYRRTLELTDVPDCAILRFDGVESAYFVWVNGEYVGFSKGSRLAAEFDVTDQLHTGINTVAVQVHKYSDGSYLENQDMLVASGIFRNVTLISCGKNYLWDYLLLPTEDGFELSADCRTSDTDAVLEAVLYDADGCEVCRARDAASAETTLKLPIADVHLWNAEDPYLYEAVLTLFVSGKAAEIHTKKVGIRFSSIEGHYIKINGSPITLKGVNRHENNAFRGRAITADQIIAELEDIKSCNLNAIRTSHYTNQPLFFEIASELGIYVMDEADIESHGMAESGDMGLLAKKDEWADAFLDRVSRAYFQNKNETCINLRSLGNEAGNDGKNLYACIEWLKERMPQIPTTYYASLFDEKNPTPFRDTGYMPMSVLKGYSPDGAPVLMLEYAHAMGNSPGGLEDIWKYVYAHDHICGGYVWEYKSHGFSSPDEEGRARYLYGGDFGDLYHWSNFSLDGFHTSDGTPKPTWDELREVSAPVWIEKNNSGITIRNTYDFTPLDGITLEWTLYSDITPVRSGIILLDGIKARETKDFDLDFSSEGFDGDIYADFIARKGEKEIAHKQIAIGSHKVHPREYGIFDYCVKECDGRITVSSDDTVIVIEDGLICRYAAGGHDLITSPIKPNFHRAPTDNDGITNFDERHAGEWKRRLVDNLRFGMHEQVIEKHPDRCVIRTVGKILPQSHNWGFDAELTYTVTDGRVEISMSGKPYGGYPKLIPRIGMTVQLPAQYDTAVWFGRGPGDSYPDRKHASYIGLYEAKIADMNFMYDVPQETGSREDTRFVRISGYGSGICAIGEFAFSCHNFTLRNLTDARHRNEIAFTEEKYLYIDHRQRGLGSHSCGPEPEEEYELHTGEFSFTFMLSPDCGNETALDLMKRI